MHAITNQKITKDGDKNQQGPRSNRDAVPPGGLRVALRVQYIIHAGNDQGAYLSRPRRSRWNNLIPHFHLEASSLTIYLGELFSLAGFVVEDALIEVVL